jgi:hypothetical protein
LLLLGCVVPEKPSLERGARAAEIVDTAVAVLQMSCEDVVIVTSSMFCWSLLEGITGTKIASLVS